MPHAFGPGNTGFIATDHINTNELIAYVPRALFLTRDDVVEGTYYKYLVDNDLINIIVGQEEVYGFTLYLLEEMKNPDSKHKDYFGTLPKEFSHLPLSYTEDEIKLLEGSAMHKRIFNQYQSLKGVFK